MGTNNDTTFVTQLALGITQCPPQYGAHVAHTMLRVFGVHITPISTYTLPLTGSIHTLHMEQTGHICLVDLLGM